MRPSTRIPPSKFICASCRTQKAARRQNFSLASRSATTAPPAPPASGLVALASRRLIAVEGPDAAKFLQGVITQNLFAGSTGVRNDACYSAILNASGRVLYDVFIYPNNNKKKSATTTSNTISLPDQNFLVEVDADQAERLEKHLKRYKLRAKVTVRLHAPGSSNVWHAWSGNGNDGVFKQQNQYHDDGFKLSSSLVNLRDPRAPGLGYRIITEGDDEPPVAAVFGEELPRVATSRPEEEEAAYRVRRYLFGVPEGPDELVQEKALPLEGNLDIMGGVDFRKGCYVGQELTIRTKHQGIVRKRILPVMLYGSNVQGEDEGSSSHGPPENLEYQPDLRMGGGAGLVDAADIPKDTSIGRVGKKGRSAGKWLRGVGNIGLALCRLETMTDVVLPGETAATSYDSGNEFVMEMSSPGGEEDGVANGISTKVKAKAFVPEWLRRGLDAQQHG